MKLTILFPSRSVASATAGLLLAVPVFAGVPGSMTREIWNNVPGTNVSDFTNSPRFWQAADSVSTFAGASAPGNIGDNHFSRIRAHITAPVSGDYTFWIASDDSSELYLSTDASKFNRVKIAALSGAVGSKQWDAKASQKSAVISLVAGQRYFIEALHKEGGGGDHCAFAWQIPGGVRTLISSSALESFTSDPTDIDNDELPDAWELANGLSINDNGSIDPDQGPHGDPDHDGYSNLEEFTYGGNPMVHGGLAGTLLLETWKNVAGSTVEDLTMSSAFGEAPSTTEFVFSAQTPSNRSDSFGARMRGYVIAPITGDYTFYIAGDENCELWLSNSASQFEKAKIASFRGNTGVNQWAKYPSQKSATRSLVAGQKYYIEALQKEQGGNDHMEIGWQIPGNATIAVISGSALESYAYDIEDPDGDNMPSSWEVTNGLDPAVNDGAEDPDMDGASNQLEYLVNTNPFVKSSTPGGLFYELWLGIPGYQVKALTSSPQFLQKPDITNLVASAQAFGQPYDAFGSRLRGYLMAPTTGSYTFWVAGNDEVELWLSTSENKFDKQLLVRPTVSHESFDIDLSQKSRVITLTAGERYYLEILHKESHVYDFCRIAWQKPGGSREIIPGSVLSSFVPTADDMDDDNLPDAWEIANGLSPNDNGSIHPKNGAQGDLDGDGLSNIAELNAGTRADLVDTDGDGVSDRDEIEMMETEALMADAAPFESVATISGGSFVSTSGSWLQENGKARQDCVRGWLEYPVTLPTAGVYQFDLAFTPVTDAGVSPDYEIVFSVDGKTIEREIVTVAQAAGGHAKILSPWLTAGNHTIRIFIDNSYWFRRVTVDQLEVLAARGTDANANGTPDWIDLRLTKNNSIESPSDSLTSPVCLEGKAKWSELTTIGGAAVQTAPDDRWYADIALHPTLATEIIASLENGGLTETRQVNWLPTNLLTTSNLSIRLGDALKLTAFAGAAGTPEESVTLTIDGQTTILTADQPLIHTFNTPGSIPIQVTHSLDGNLTTTTATIKVVTVPAIESPVCVVGSYREVAIPALPAGVSLQLDNRIDVRSTTNYPAGSQLHVLRLNTLDDRTSVFRLGGTMGPILRLLPLRHLSICDGDQTAVYLTKIISNNTYAFDMPVIVNGDLKNVILKYEIFIGGVTFDDGSISKTIDSFSNTNNIFTLKFLKYGLSGSNCYRLTVYNNGKRIAFFQ